MSANVQKKVKRESFFVDNDIFFVTLPHNTQAEVGKENIFSRFLCLSWLYECKRCHW
jgi:hypothetical protein